MSGFLENYTALPLIPRWPEIRRRVDGRFERNWTITFAGTLPILSAEEVEDKKQDLSRDLRSAVEAIQRLGAMSRGQPSTSDRPSLSQDDYAVEITICSPTSVTFTVATQGQGGGAEYWYSTKLLLHKVEQWLGRILTINGQPRAIWHSLLDASPLGNSKPS